MKLRKQENTHTKVRKYSDLHDQDEKTLEGADEGEKKQQVSKLSAGNRWTSRHVFTAGERVVDIFVALNLLLSGYTQVCYLKNLHTFTTAPPGHFRYWLLTLTSACSGENRADHVISVSCG